jgi:tryptophan synthase beta chain
VREPGSFRPPEADAAGRFGAFGGRFVPETLMAPLYELEAAWKEARRDPEFRKEL